MKKMERWPMLFEDVHEAQGTRIHGSHGHDDRRSADWLGVVSRRLSAAFQLTCLLGMFMFLATEAKGVPPNPPPGPYHQSCRGVSANGTTLTATCKDFFGNFRKTDISNYAACTGSFKDVNGGNHPLTIENIDGRLTCVISKGIRRDKFDTGSVFDVISMPTHFTRGNEEETVWRIDRPRVWSSKRDGEVDYPMITFKPGDRLSFLAGGCVQTGGRGRTWKRYADPSGPNAEELYWGTVSIPGVTQSTFEKVGLVAKQGQKIIPPPPPGTNPNELPKNILRLGYIDNELDDNGYYSHDDGTDDQCKNEGPAWVQVTVLSGVKVSGPLLSPHSKPFDLVWDMATQEDENQLPMNPQWNFTLNDPHHQQPHFIPICGRAFPSKPVGQYEVDPGTLRQICTSMSYDFDLRPSGGGLCGGDPFPGHMNFGIATYQGLISWGDYSGPSPNDNDWAFELIPRNGAGLAGSGDGGDAAASLHLEFDGMEVPLPITPFWKDLIVPPAPFPLPNPSIGPKFAGPDGHGLPGVAIGVVGLDGVHGANTEMHPLYAMAVRLSQTLQQPGLVREQWAFFLRNFGDEGTCSENVWHWGDGVKDFFIPLEWPGGATGDVTHDSDVMRWQGAPTPVDIQVNKEQRFTYIHVGAPEGLDEFGAGGTITLIYKVTGTPKMRKTTARTSAPTPAPTRETEETEAKDLSPRITDPAVRAKYLAAMKALPPMTAPRAAVGFHVDVPAAVTVRKHVPGAASRGQIIRPRAVPNKVKIEHDLAMFKILQTYQKDLNIELPATLPQSLTPVAPQAQTK